MTCKCERCRKRAMHTEEHEGGGGGAIVLFGFAIIFGLFAWLAGSPPPQTVEKQRSAIGHVETVGPRSSAPIGAIRIPGTNLSVW